MTSFLFFFGGGQETAIREALAKYTETYSSMISRKVNWNLFIYDISEKYTETYSSMLFQKYKQKLIHLWNFRKVHRNLFLYEISEKYTETYSSWYFGIKYRNLSISDISEKYTETYSYMIFQKSIQKLIHLWYLRKV